jgi:serine/threonine protein kinase/WD40 repeat protein
MTAQTSGRDPVEKLAEEFAERFRRGERPSLTEYTDRYPELAEEIRELFPALLEIEQLASVDSQGTGPHLPASPTGRPAFEQLGEYRILREVGRGGMGMVYEAVQESLGRHVALKVLPYHGLLSPVQLERFRREARAAARLHHTNIVPIFGVGEDSGTHFYAMQFIQGQGLDVVLDDVRRLRGSFTQADRADGPAARSLSEQVARGLVSGQFERPPADAVAAEPVVPTVAPAGAGPEPAAADTHFQLHPAESTATLASLTETQYYRSVAQVGIQVAEALEYAHVQGILHRDIKPSNLLLDTHGIVWVADFGLAKAEDSDDLTNTGDLVGTLRFMAPERFEGRCDVRSEVYSIGLTLYEALTLRAAFEERDRLALINRVKHEEPPRPCQVDAKIPRDLETIVLKAIAKEPADRYATAAELAEDLRRFLADRPIRARRTPWQERVWRWCRRNPAVASLTAFVLLLLVAVAAVSAASALWLRQERDRVVRAKEDLGKEHERTVKERDRAEDAERDAKEKLCRSYRDQAWAGRMSRRVGQRLDSLRALTASAKLARELDLPEDRFLELRNEAIACMALPDLRRGPSWEGWPTGTKDLVFDSSYQRYARADNQGNISIRRVADDQEITQLAGSGQAIDGLLFSPDGQFLATSVRGQGTQVWHVARRQKIPVPVSAWHFSPDSRQIASFRSDGSISLYNLETGKETKRLRLGTAPDHFAFHPSDRQLAVSRDNSASVDIWDADSEAIVTKLPLGTERVCSIAWHPDGRRLALGFGSSRAEIWDVATRQRVATMEGHAQDVVELSFHPSGDLLATLSWDGTTRLWNAWTGQPAVTWHGQIHNMHFSRDGGLLGATVMGTELALVEVTPSQEYHTFVSSLGAGKGGYREIDVSPDGRLLAVGMDDGVRLLELASGRELAFLPLAQTLSVIFQPSGRELLTCGRGGLRRWHIRMDAAAPNRLHIGPPHAVPLPVVPHLARCSQDRGTLAIAGRAMGMAVVVDLTTEAVQSRLAPHSGLNHAALSPDGQWAATAGWNAKSAKVWNARTGEMVKELPLGGPIGVFFTPDNKTLVTTRGGEYCFWDMRSWQLIRQLRWDIATHYGVVAFSPDGKLMALELSAGIIHLMEIATGRTLAKLEDPNLDRPTWICFTPDGTQLVTTAVYAKAVHVWDLRRIRAQLAMMDLDWDAPPFPPVKPQEGGANAAPLRVEVILPEQAGGPKS